MRIKQTTAAFQTHNLKTQNSQLKNSKQTTENLETFNLKTQNLQSMFHGRNIRFRPPKRPSGKNIRFVYEKYIFVRKRITRYENRGVFAVLNNVKLYFSC